MPSIVNRLWFRLVLALVAVALVSVGVVAVLANITAATLVQNFVRRQEVINQSRVTEELAEYYETNGSWVGASRVLTAVSSVLPAPQRPDNNNGEPPRRTRGRTTFVLADANGNILVDVERNRIGVALANEERAVALPISTTKGIVGFVLVSSPTQTLLIEAQQLFLSQLQRTLLFAAFIAALLALLLSTLLSRAIASPLAQLAQVARAFSSRQWQVRVTSNPTQEINDVAQAFNHMAQSLQQAEENRRNLTADIAHELRTPLSVIQGNLRAMLDNVYPLERSEIATLYDETRLLSRLVDDLRELALAEAGQLQLRPQTLDVNALLQRTADQFAIAADARNVQLQVQAVAALPFVFADGDRVSQVLRNLIVNALRHTPENGAVTLSATHDNKFVRIQVRDTGEGIAADDLPHVFNRFYRGDKSRARSSGGTGLGLSIALTLIEMMGGQMGVTSEIGQGATFWFRLPIQR